MSSADRMRWDDRHRSSTMSDAPAPPGEFEAHLREFPDRGSALEIACGTGSVAVWLAGRGLDVTAGDVSPVAIGAARALAVAAGVARRCRFVVADLDDGLPAGPPVDVLVCRRFRDARLDRAITERLAPGGLLAISVLSEVGASPGPYRASAGELTRAFGALDVVTAGESAGLAWLLARR